MNLMTQRPPCSPADMAQRLDSLGYETKVHSGDEFITAVKAFQDFNGLKVDGMAGPFTEDLLMWTRRCANPDIQRAGTCKWPMLAVDYWHDLAFGNMSQADVNKAFVDACESWNAVCGINLVQIINKSDANIYAHSKKIDGRGGTLAWSFLPCNSSRNTRLQQRYDTRENWTQTWLQSVIAHEIGHALGLDHDRADTLMGAYSSGIVLPTARDIAQVVRRYGEPVAPPTPVPPPTPTTPPPTTPPGETPTVDGQILIDGKPYILVPEVDFTPI